MIAKSDNVRSRLFVRIAQALIVGVSLFFLLSQVIEHWNRIEQSIDEISWLGFGFAVFLFFFAWILLPLPSYLVLRAQEFSVPYLDVVGMFNASQMVKYLPGGLWALPGRAVLYQRRHDVPLTRGTTSVILETGALLAGALIVGSLALPLVMRISALSAWLFMFAIVLVLCRQMFRGIPRLPIPWTRMPSLLHFRLSVPPEFNLGLICAMIAATISFWALTGIVFAGLVAVLQVELMWYQAAGAFALAWALGFLIVVVPAGLGVREAFLVVILRSAVPYDDAVLISLVARLWWSIVELAWVVIGIILLRKQTPGLRPYDQE
jgi:uncharacterized membrane protein YbhN (UPF0104 family)